MERTPEISTAPSTVIGGKKTPCWRGGLDIPSIFFHTSTDTTTTRVLSIRKNKRDLVDSLLWKERGPNPGVAEDP